MGRLDTITSGHVTRLIALGLAVVVLAGCGSREDPGGPEQPTAHAVVEGQVGTRAGDPVAGATVDLTAKGQSSGDVIATASTVTGGGGAFRVSLLADSSLPQVTDLEVTVHGAAGAGLATRTLTGSTLTFGADDPATDTLRLRLRSTWHAWSACCTKSCPADCRRSRGRITARTAWR